MESLLPFLLFSFVASITPGPTNILVMSHSSRRGLTATVPIIFGACVSAALVVLVVGLAWGKPCCAIPACSRRWPGPACCG